MKTIPWDKGRRQRSQYQQNLAFASTCRGQNTVGRTKWISQEQCKRKRENTCIGWCPFEQVLIITAVQPFRMYCSKILLLPNFSLMSNQFCLVCMSLRTGNTKADIWILREGPDKLCMKHPKPEWKHWLILASWSKPSLEAWFVFPTICRLEKRKQTKPKFCHILWNETCQSHKRKHGDAPMNCKNTCICGLKVLGDFMTLSTGKERKDGRQMEMGKATWTHARKPGRVSGTWWYKPRHRWLYTSSRIRTGWWIGMQ